MYIITIGVAVADTNVKINFYTSGDLVVDQPIISVLSISVHTQHCVSNCITINVSQLIMCVSVYVVANTYYMYIIMCNEVINYQHNLEQCIVFMMNRSLVMNRRSIDIIIYIHP